MVYLHLLRFLDSASNNSESEDVSSPILLKACSGLKGQKQDHS